MLDLLLIKKLFKALNAELEKSDSKGEILVCGGAAMCLVFHARKSTKDVDAIFQPTEAIRKASRKVAHQFGIQEDWLNDAAKAYFHSDPPREPVLEFSSLRVWAPKADYLLAMKCLSARFDTHDKEDVEFLVKYLKLSSAEEVFKIISRYYPDQMISPKTKFFVEELMSK